MYVLLWPVQYAESRDFCLIFELTVTDANLLKSCGCFTRSEVMKAFFRYHGGQVDKLVPVKIGETIEEPERIVLWLAVPILKRLLVFDHSLMNRSQEADSAHDGV